MIIKREIGEKGQVVIPKDIRDHLGLDIGVNVSFEVEDDKIILKKENNEKFLEEFLNTPKLKRRKKTIKEMIMEQYE